MRPGGLLAALAELSRAAAGDFAVEKLLQTLCDGAADALDVDGVGVMISGPSGNRFVHATDATVLPLERLQEVLQAGPCADGARERATVVSPDLATDGRWPQFQLLAADLGVGSVVSVPLLSRGRAWGALDLYRRSAGPWEDDVLEAAQALAGVAVSYVVMAYDRDELRQAHQELGHRAMHDDLTGLPNRILLLDRLEHALAGCARSGSTVAVVFLDLDLFKGVNDAYGHAAADLVLVAVAKRLSGTLRDGDTLARFAGDEFVLVCEALPHEDARGVTRRVAAVTGRLQAALREPFSAGTDDVVLTASIGVAITSSRMDAQDLIAEADAAMYAAKEGGRGQLRIRDRSTGGAADYADRLEHDLAGALRRAELRTYYQPIVCATSGQVVAVEVLLRWQQPDGVVLPAAAFIDIAVGAGLIPAIGRWVVEETCAQMQRWQHTLGDRSPQTAYVNVSAQELADPTLVDVVGRAVQRNGLLPEQLGLEIVEHHLADPAILRRLETFGAAGHPLSVDDFGTGYSSLSRLADLPIQVAKIDKSLVAGLPEDHRRGRLVDGVVVLASLLDFQVVAEGVESSKQQERLASAGCQLLQGFHLSMPQPGDQLTELLR